MELKNKKVAVLLLCALIVLVFFGCQTSSNIEDALSQTDVYKYGTKEFNLQNQANFCDYGARNYDGARARFATPDPVAETYPSVSPYAYTVKTPIYIDLKGDSLTVVNGKVFFAPADSLLRK